MLISAWHEVESSWQEPEELLAWMLRSRKRQRIPRGSAKELPHWESSPCGTLAPGCPGPSGRTLPPGGFLPAAPTLLSSGMTLAHPSGWAQLSPPPRWARFPPKLLAQPVLVSTVTLLKRCCFIFWMNSPCPEGVLVKTRGHSPDSVV